jgi:hypothetical protein
MGHQFSFGTLQGVFSKADARLASFNGRGTLYLGVPCPGE